MSQSASDMVAQRLDKIETLSERLDERIATQNTELAKIKHTLARLREGPARDNVKRRGVRLLHQRRQYEQQRTVLDKQKDQVVSMMLGLQQAASLAEQRQAVRDVREAADAVQTVTVEEAAKLAQDLSERFADQEEVAELLNRSYSSQDATDDAELQKELSAMEHDLLARYVGGARRIKKEERRVRTDVCHTHAAFVCVACLVYAFPRSAGHDTSYLDSALPWKRPRLDPLPSAPVADSRDDALDAELARLEATLDGPEALLH